MEQTEARKILKDAPVMWRRINAIGIILDCNSTYATNLGYAKSEILGRSIFEHVPKESWHDMNSSLKRWFETGKVDNIRITFRRHDSSTFTGLLHATSIYDKGGEMIGSNTVIIDLDMLDDEFAEDCEGFFRLASGKLESIKESYGSLDYSSKAEYDGLRDMFDMLLMLDVKGLKA